MDGMDLNRLLSDFTCECKRVDECNNDANNGYVQCDKAWQVDFIFDMDKKSERVEYFDEIFWRVLKLQELSISKYNRCGRLKQVIITGQGKRVKDAPMPKLSQFPSNIKIKIGNKSYTYKAIAALEAI